MPKPNPATTEATAKIMALFRENPERVFTVQEVRHHIKDNSKNLNDALVNLARTKKCPIIRVGYGKYVFVTASSVPKKAAPVKAKTAPSKPVDDAPQPEPQSAPSWFKVKFVPPALTAFIPLKDGEKVVVTEDDRYFILTELSAP